MKHLYEEVAYLKGLAEGLEISAESKEGKMIFIKKMTMRMMRTSAI